MGLFDHWVSLVNISQWSTSLSLTRIGAWLLRFDPWTFLLLLGPILFAHSTWFSHPSSHPAHLTLNSEIMDMLEAFLNVFLRYSNYIIWNLYDTFKTSWDKKESSSFVFLFLFQTLVIELLSQWIVFLKSNIKKKK